VNLVKVTRTPPISISFIVVHEAQIQQCLEADSADAKLLEPEELIPGNFTQTKITNINGSIEETNHESIQDSKGKLTSGADVQYFLQLDNVPLLCSVIFFAIIVLFRYRSIDCS